MTKFLRRDPQFASKELEALGAQVFGDTGLRFHLPNVLVAQRASSLLETRALCLDYSDSYSSAGFLSFDHGHLDEYAIAGWDGTASYVTFRDGQRWSGTQEERRPYDAVHAVLARAWDCLRLPFADMDDLIEAFAVEGVGKSYVLVEDRRVLSVPRPVRP